MQLLDDLIGRVGSGLAKHFQRLSRLGCPGGGEPGQSVQGVAEGGLILAPEGRPGPLQEHGQIVRLDLEDLFHQPLIFGFTAGGPLLADYLSQRIQGSQIAWVFQGSLAKVSHGRGEPPLFLSQDSQEGFDLTALWCQLACLFQVLRRLCQVVFA